MVLAHENNIPTHQKCTSLGDGWDFVSLSPTVVSENVAAEIIKPVVFYLRGGGARSGQNCMQQKQSETISCQKREMPMLGICRVTGARSKISVHFSFI